MHSESGWKDGSGKNALTWSDFWRDHQTGAGSSSSAAAGHRIPPPAQPYEYRRLGHESAGRDARRAVHPGTPTLRDEGGFPDLVILFLPNDHTAGTTAKYPTPGAMVADNDLALGQIVEALSRSRFWPETCLFAIEDDPRPAGIM